MLERIRAGVRLLPSTAHEKRERDISYLMELREESMLLPYYNESGLSGRMNYRLEQTHGGWDNPLSQIRGTFLGHFLSAAAYAVCGTGDGRLKAKADYIVAELYRCQQANGNGWAFSIPEKYLYGLIRGQRFWAPQYVCHKTMMGLMDMYLLTENKQALEILYGCADWFAQFTEHITREKMNQIMAFEETGGLMEVWADLYAVTGAPKHLKLMKRYERPELMEPLCKGKDVLTNMHANATVVEILGCARAFEITGEERYKIATENYWELAVRKRGVFATGGSTDGEIWTPPGKQSSRLSDMNQEHCVVYHMIRLADYLYRFSGKREYLDYIEKNIENGIYAQGFWKARTLDGACEPHEADTGVVCYYLPLMAGSSKKWGRKTEDFWCCHGTAVQANTRYIEWIYYRMTEGIVIAQYIPSVLETEVAGSRIQITMEEDDLCGDCIEIKAVAGEIPVRPNYLQYRIRIQSDGTEVMIKLRIPEWVYGDVKLWINGVAVDVTAEDGYVQLKKEWTNDIITICLPKHLSTYPLSDDADCVAFMDGPVLLAGITDQEVLLYGEKERPETILRPHHEREWNSWRNDYKTIGQQKGIYFKPLKDIGRETYAVYFPIKKADC